ncbi:MAG: dienelactone hydrolase family protein, partial [Fulvivirga sp.]
PWLSSALSVIEEVVEEIKNNGISTENVYLLGFSQGACLTLEFVARNATRWGGVVAFTGGLIGDKLDKENYKGDFAGTPIFIGTNDPDPHVPVVRVLESVEVLKVMHAKITTEVYKNMGHTISQDELGKANELVFNL